MKPILFIAYITGIIYAALHWSWVGYAAAGCFATGGIYLIYKAAFNYLQGHRLL